MSSRGNWMGTSWPSCVLHFKSKWMRRQCWTQSSCQDWVCNTFNRAVPYKSEWTSEFFFLLYCLQLLWPCRSMHRQTYATSLTAFLYSWIETLQFHAMLLLSLAGSGIFITLAICSDLLQDDNYFSAPTASCGFLSPWHSQWFLKKGPPPTAFVQIAMKIWSAVRCCQIPLSQTMREMIININS